MHYGQIFTSDCANGIGMRVSLFVSGCTNCCEGCFQPETWDFNYGKEFTCETEQFIIDELSKSYYQGLSILGGEPMEPQNQKEVAHLVQRVKETYPTKTIWMYTGFEYEKDLLPGCRKYTEFTDVILDGIDIMVDGRFDISKRNLLLKFKGSENQRIIDMKETRKCGRVVLDALND